MNVWNIQYDDQEFQLSISNCTILFNSSPDWYEIIRKISDYFNSRVNDIFIAEGDLVITKKDWHCYFIPFDSDLNMDKINSKSPLINILNDTVNYLDRSPVYAALQEVWGELQEEMFFVNESFMKYDVRANIKDIKSENIGKFVQLESTQRQFGPSECKLLHLRLINDMPIGKKTLVIIELPELYSNTDNIKEMLALIRDMLKKGIKFIIVTGERKFPGIKNYILEEVIINEYKVESLRERVINEVPFLVEREDFTRAKELFLMDVDNLVNGNDRSDFKSIDIRIRVLIFMLFKRLELKGNIELTGLPVNIERFIYNYY